MSAQGRLVLPAAAAACRPSAKLRLSCQLHASRAHAPPARTWGLIMPRFHPTGNRPHLPPQPVLHCHAAGERRHLPLRSVNHISRVCCDVAATAAFYADLLGFIPVQRPQSLEEKFEGCWWVLGGRVRPVGAGGGCWAGAGPASLPLLLLLPNWEAADGTGCGSGPACLGPDCSTGSSAPTSPPSCRLWRYGLGLHLIEGEPVPRSSQIDPSEPLSSCCCSGWRVQQAHSLQQADGPAGPSSLPLLVCRWPARMHGVAFECHLTFASLLLLPPPLRCRERPPQLPGGFPGAGTSCVHRSAAPTRHPWHLTAGSLLLPCCSPALLAAAPCTAGAFMLPTCPTFAQHPTGRLAGGGGR